MQVWGKDECIFVDSPVLDNRFSRCPDFKYFLKPVVQVIHLHMERPALHILVEVINIGIGFYVLILWLPVVLAGEQLRERCLPGAYITSDTNMLKCFCSRHNFYFPIPIISLTS